MELIDWITLAIFTMIGMVIGWRASAAFYVKMFSHILRDLGITNAQLIKSARDAALAAGIDIGDQLNQIESQATDEDGLEKIEIKVEKHSDTLYAFRKDNDQFLGQGSTRESLIEAMGQRLKNVRLIVVEGDEYMKSEA